MVGLSPLITPTGGARLNVLTDDNEISMAALREAEAAVEAQRQNVLSMREGFAKLSARRVLEELEWNAKMAAQDARKASTSAQEFGCDKPQLSRDYRPSTECVHLLAAIRYLTFNCGRETKPSPVCYDLLWKETSNRTSELDEISSLRPRGMELTSAKERTRKRYAYRSLVESNTPRGSLITNVYYVYAEVYILYRFATCRRIA